MKISHISHKVITLKRIFPTNYRKIGHIFNREHYLGLHGYDKNTDMYVKIFD